MHIPILRPLAVTNQRPRCVGAMAALDYTPGVEAACKFVTRFGDEVNMSIRDGGTLWVPRNLVQDTALEDYQTDNFMGAINCTAPPRNHEQAQIIKDSIELLKTGRSHVIEAPTGFGKTYLGCAIAGQVGHTTLIVVTKNDLVTSWRDTLIHLMGIPETKIGHVQQDRCDFKGKRFVIGMVHSLVLPDRYPPEFYSYFGTVIFDETHRMAADGFIKACQIFKARRRLGLSATPKRSDGKERLLEAHIGPIALKGTIVPMKAKILVKRTGYAIPKRQRKSAAGYRMEPIPHSPGKMMAVFKDMAQNLNRNQMIVEFTQQAYKAGRTTVIMADTLEHLNVLFQAAARAGIPGEEMGFYIGQGNKNQTAAKAALKFASKKPVVFATYTMCSEGTDCPWWDTLVFATPRTNIKQPLGRILRFLEGKKQPVCLDLVDSDQIFNGFFYKRQRQYAEVGAEVVRVDR